MKLSKGEFCQFNLKSKINLLGDNGTLLMTKKLDEAYEIKLFLIYDFYVEAFCNYKYNKIERVQPIINNNWMDFYFNQT